MSTLSKMLIAAVAGLLIGGGAFVGAATNDGKTAKTETVTTTETTGADLRGPCDEAEHASDPRCNGPQAPGDNAGEPGEPGEHAGQAGEDVGDDNPGEVEDQNGVDNSGPGNAGDREDGGDQVDNSGPGSMNSGPGNAEDDQGTESHSGSGHDGSGDDSSGQGGDD